MVPSALRNITVSPAAAFTGFGENAEFPDDETIETETVAVVGAVDVGVGVGAGAGAGVGAAAVGVGDVGVDATPPPPPPQFHNAKAPSTATTAPGGIECRIQSILLLRSKANHVPHNLPEISSVTATLVYAP